MSVSELPSLPVPAHGRQPGARANFLPYPVSTLGPAIVPEDLTGFRTRGAARVEKALLQELKELGEQYSRAIDRFNWNQLVYGSRFQFEPVIGETYHLYRDGTGFLLSMIGPDEWPKPWIGSFRLNVDSCWEPMRLAEGVDRQALFGGGGPQA